MTRRTKAALASAAIAVVVGYRAVCSSAHDTADARMLLSALGLDGGEA